MKKNDKKNPKNPRIFSLAIVGIAGAFLALSGCAQQISDATGIIDGQHRLKTPAGIGPGTNDLKLLSLCLYRP